MKKRGGTFSSVETDMWGRTKLIAKTGDNDESEDSASDADKAADDKWYKKPVGIVLLSAIAGIVAGVTVMFIRHYFSL